MRQLGHIMEKLKELGNIADMLENERASSYFGYARK